MELQRLKPLHLFESDVVAEATTHKDSDLPNADQPHNWNA